MPDNGLLKTLLPLAGAAIGTAIAPGVGTQLGFSAGGALGAATGGGAHGGTSGTPAPGKASDTIATMLSLSQLLGSVRDKQKATRLMPPTIDPNEARYQDQLNDLRSGSGARYAETIRQLRNNMATGAQQINNQAGGYGGAAIAGLVALNRGYGDAIGKAGIDSAGQNLAYNQLYGAQVNRAADRVADLSSRNWAQSLLDSRGKQTAANSNILATSPFQPTSDGSAGGDFESAIQEVLAMHKLHQSTADGMSSPTLDPNQVNYPHSAFLYNPTPPPSFGTPAFTNTTSFNNLFK